jgi:hypothetical protein
LDRKGQHRFRLKGNDLNGITRLARYQSQLHAINVESATLGSKRLVAEVRYPHDKTAASRLLLMEQVVVTEIVG